MLRQLFRPSHKPRLGAFRALIFYPAVAFLLLTLFHGGHSQAIGRPQPIVAMVGDDITLPCHVKPAADVFNEMLEWSRPDLDPRFVHVRRSGEDHLPDQNQFYRGRTSVSIDSLKLGDVSLKLSKVKLSDEGTYRCSIPGLESESSVQLVVDSSSLSASAVIGVIVGIISILAVVFLVWKWRQNKLKTRKYHGDEEKLKARDKESNFTNNDPEQKFLIVRETDREKHTAEEETMRNLDLKIKCEESGFTHHEQPVTENKSDNVLVQKEGEMEIQSVNAGTGRMEDVRQQDEVQTVGQTESRVMSEANEAPYPAEEEGQQDKDKDKNNEGQNTTAIQNDTKPQPPINGLKDQLPAVQSNVDKKDEDEETKSGNTGTADQGLKEHTQEEEEERGEEGGDEKEKTQSTNGKAEGQDPTGGKTQQEAQQAAGKTNNHLDQTRIEENEDSCLAKKDGQQDKNRYRRDDGESTTPEKDDTLSQPPVNGQTNQPQAGKTDLDKKDAEEKPKPGDNKTTDQVPTEVETEQNAQQEGRETNNNLDQTGNEEKEASCPTKKEGQQDKNKDGRDGEENLREPIKDNTKPQSPADGQTDQISAEDVKSNEDNKEKMEQTGLPGQTEGETHGEQPENNQKGAGGGGKPSISTKPKAAKSARRKKRRRRK